MGALFLIPLLWLVFTSLKPAHQVFSDPPRWIPDPVQWENYVEALTSPAFPVLRLMGNSIFYAGASTVGVVVSSTIVAYAFARIEFRGRETLFLVTLATMMMPTIVTLIPNYVLFRQLGWVGSYAPLIVPHFFGSAFSIFLLRQFMRTVPWDLTDAARVDGAGELTILWKIVVPMIKPALMVVAIFQFIASWNDFLGPLIYLTDSSQFPVVLGIYTFQTRFFFEWNLTMAASVIATVPLFLLFFAGQRYFLEGINLSGVRE